MTTQDPTPDPLPVRRVITGEDTAGRAGFAHIETVQPVRGPADRIVYPVWGLDEPPSLPVDVVRGFLPSALPPARGGYRVRIMQFLPDQPANAHHEERGQVIGDRLREIDLETGLHATNSIDIGIVLEGEVTLIEDDGVEVTLKPWDVLVQNGTRHRWENRSGKPCTMAVVFLAADPD